MNQLSLCRSGAWVAVLFCPLALQSVARAGAPACAIAENQLAFVLTRAHGDITTESHAYARGANWLTATTFTTDDGFFSNQLDISGTARHVMPPPLAPHGEGINPNQYTHSFTALVDGLAAGNYTHNDFEVIVVVAPPLMHGGHFNHFRRSVSLRVGTSDDILNYEFTLIGRHSEFSLIDIYTGRYLYSLNPSGPIHGTTSLLVEPNGRFTLGSNVAGITPADIVASHIHSSLDGSILHDMGDGSQWTNLDGLAASRAITDDQLSPFAQQLMTSGHGVVDIHLRTGQIIQGNLQLIPEPTAITLIALLPLGALALRRSRSISKH